MANEDGKGQRVWVVTAAMCIPYMIEDDTQIVGVFSTEEKAQEAERDCMAWMKGLPEEHVMLSRAKFSTEIYCIELDTIQEILFVDM